MSQALLDEPHQPFMKQMGAAMQNKCLSRNGRQSLSAIRLITIMVIVVCMLSAAASWASSPVTTKIIVGGEVDYPPYSFLDKNGEPNGFSVELTRAIAKTMGMEVEIRLSPWPEARKSLEDGSIDMIPGMFYSEERARIYDFSPPFSIVSEAVFVRTNSPPVKSVEDLRNKEIIVMRGEAMHDYILKHRLTDRILLTETPGDALRLLASGKGDYALVAQMPGFYWIKELKLSNIKTGGPSLEQFKNCFAVRKGNDLLLSRFTEGLNILKQTGEYEWLYEKWLGVLEPDKITPRLAIQYAAIIFVPLILLLAFSLLWSWMLRSKVNQKTKELRESEEKHRILLDESPDPIFSLTAAGQYLYINRAFAEGVGKAMTEIAGRKLWDVFPKDEADKRFAILSQVYRTGEEKVIETRVSRPDGDHFYLTTITPIRDAQGNAATAICSSKDITGRKQAEDALRASRNMLDHILNTIPQSVFWKDRQSRYLGCNMQFARAAGLASPDAIIGKTDFDLPWLREEAEAYRNDDRLVMDSGKPKPHIIEPLQQADGSRLWIDTTKVPLIDDKGCVHGVLGVYEDITERKRAEEALREREEKYRTLFQTGADGIVVHDARGTNIDANARACEMLGYSRDELLALQISDLIPPEELQQNPPHLAEAFTGRPVCYEGKLRRKDGTLLDIEIRAGRFGEDRVQAFWRDITERKQAEEEKAKLQAQLAQAQKMESVGRLAGGVAHDFNNMLGAILGYTELALDHVEPGQALHADLTEIHKAATRSADLTRQLLAFARKQTIAPRIIDLNKTVAGMLSMLQRLIGEDIDLAWLPGKDLEPVKVDPSQVDQILANLCVNARDAITDVGKVTIETGAAAFDEAYCADHAGFVSGDYVMLAVSDNGCGMDTETLSKIFDPFFTTKELGKGTGLGMASVYGAVKQNNGFINVYSEPGHGTTFRIYLPQHRDREELPAAKGPDLPSGCGRETILLVEDEPAILRMATMMIERLGYAVIGAQTPGEAIRLANEHAGAIHLLMTDVVMPEMNGRDLAGNLLSIYPGIKRLFMSGYTADVIAHHGVLDPGVHFIQKPFSIKDLAAKLREVLDRE